jgi:hypothetical protein
MQEVTKNVDGYRLSTFFYKQRESDGGKLVMGPIWDLNLGFGNANYCTNGNPEGFVLNFNNICPDDYWLIPFWWKRLLQHSSFRTKVATRWAELRAGVFTENAIHTYIDSVASVLNLESQARNFKAWNVLGKHIWPNYYVGPTFQSEVNWLKGWVAQRLVWLDQNMPALVTAAEENGESLEDTHAYPNPFSSDVTINYSIQKSGEVDISIWDSTGRNVNSVKIHHDTSGRYSYTWQRDISGIYYYSVKQGTNSIGDGKLFKK